MNEFEMLTEHPDNDKQKHGFELRKEDMVHVTDHILP